MRAKSGALLWMGLVVAGSCSEPTAPPDPNPTPVEVTLTVAALRGPEYAITPEGAAVTVCEVDLRATATGTGSAEFWGSVLRLYIGPDRSGPVDSLVVESADIRNAFGAERIFAGQSHTATIRLAADLPWSLEAVVRFRQPDNGPITEAKTLIRCEPPATPAAAPPAVGAITVTHATPAQPGAVVRVAYTATSAAGVWKTVASASGPCFVRQEFAERTAVTTSRTADLQLPATCPLGAPIGLRVEVTDVYGRETVVVADSVLRLADVTRPTVFPFFYTPNGAMMFGGPRGTYFVGDSIRGSIGAQDNGLLRSAHWEEMVSGTRDSVLSVGVDRYTGVGILVRPEWLGEPRLRFYAIDAAGLVSDTVLSDPDLFSVRPSVARATRTLNLGVGDVVDLELSASRALAVALQNGVGIRLVSLASGQLVRTISRPAGQAQPMELAMSITGDTLFVALSGRRLGILDLTVADAPLVEVPIALLADSTSWSLQGIAATSVGTLLITAVRGDPFRNRLIEFDPATSAESPLSLAVGEGDLERNADGSRVLIPAPSFGCVIRLEFPTRTELSACGAGEGPRNLDPTGTWVASGFNVFDGSLQRWNDLQLPLGGNLLGFQTAVGFDAPAAHFLYAGLHNGVAAIFRSRLSDGRLVDRTRMPFTATLLRTGVDGTELVATGWTVGGTTLAIVEWQ